MTGLTTGAVTHILDRLEKRGFVERARDPSDRRKVFVRARPESIEPLMPKYEAVGKAYMKLVEGYSDKELQLICDYLEKTSELSERELARIVAANRAQAPAAVDGPAGEPAQGRNRENDLNFCGVERTRP